GGRVDAADQDGHESWCDGISEVVRQMPSVSPADAVAHAVAAARELFEEAGVLLARSSRDGSFVSLSDDGSQRRFTSHRSDVHAGRRTLRAILDEEELRLALDALVSFAHWV